VAREFVRQYTVDGMIGIVFLGAIARGYYDALADIDIALFKKRKAVFAMPAMFQKVKGLEIHSHVENYKTETQATWDMGKRWTYSQAQIHYDPNGLTVRLLQNKVPLQPEEKKWMLISGLVLSEWYINRLTTLWVERGNIISAQHMFDQGLNYFYEMLFALNGQLVADMKWRYNCVERLNCLPQHYRESIQEVMLLNAFTDEEIERRKGIFIGMWQQMVHLVEQEVQMPYNEFKELV